MRWWIDLARGDCDSSPVDMSEVWADSEEEALVEANREFGRYLQDHPRGHFVATPMGDED